MKKALILIISLLVTYSVSAQILKPVKWTTTVSKKAPKVGETVDVVFTGKLDKGWYLYSSELKVEGPMPTEVSFTASKDFQIIGKLTAVNPKEKFDEVWDGKIAYFVKEAKFIQKVKVLSPNVKIEGKITCQTCTEKDGKCIPNKDKFSLSL